MSTASAFRERHIGSDGATVVLVVGATGSGKSTLVRRLIGADDEADFPAVSTTKTTVATTEVLFDGSTAPAAVATFRSEAEVRAAVWENLEATATAIGHGRPAASVVDALVEHAEQRIRLLPLLGDLVDEHHPPEPYRTLLDHLRAAAIAHRGGSKDRERVLGALTEHVVDHLRLRLNELGSGNLVHERSRWPLGWWTTAPTVGELLEHLRPLVSNDARLFGSLVTPLVDGVRARGPFGPGGLRGPIMLVDSEGLGHVQATATSLPPALLDQLSDADAVLVVDNATQPVQAASAGALRQIAVRGHARKVGFCFTHVDQLVGPDLRTQAAKRRRLAVSLRETCDDLARQLGPSSGRALRDLLDERTVLLDGLDRPDAGAAATEAIDGLLARILDGGAPRGPEVRPARPASPLDGDALEAAVEEAFVDYETRWRAILGLDPPHSPERRPWQTVKALARRLADGTADGFGELLPAEDLALAVVASVRRTLDDQLADSDAAGPIDAVCAELSDRVRHATAEHLIRRQRNGWIDAYRRSGTGSATERAETIGRYLLGPTMRTDPPSGLHEACVEAVLAAIGLGGFVIGADGDAHAPPPPDAPLPEPLAAARPATWSVELDLCDSAVRPLLEAARDLGAPEPVIGWEVRDEAISGWMVEAAWPDRGVGVVFDTDDERDRWLVEHRWDARRVTAWTAHELAAALADRRNGEVV
ncbi:MAG: hypothetical protein S0880_20870 [Actinomycetota bacterium]|nr:hypothetical protein [Actinomycetota bacterium]